MLQEETSYVTLKQETQGLLRRLRALEPKIKYEVEHNNSYFKVGGYSASTSYCNGQLMVVPWYAEEATESGAHSHKGAEIILIEEGSGLVKLENEEILLDPKLKPAVFLLPNQKHNVFITKYPAKGYAILSPPDIALLGNTREACDSLEPNSFCQKCKSAPEDNF